MKDTPFTIVLSKLGDLLVLNLLCLFCSLPVITAGPAVSALYAVLFRQNRQEQGHLAAGFFTAFRQNFRQALVLEAIICLIALFGITDLRFALAVGGSLGTLFLTVGTVVTAIALILQTMAVPQQAVYCNTVRNYLTNSFALAFCAPGRLLLSIAAWVIPWLLLLAMPEFFLNKLGAAYLMWGISAPAWVTVKLLDSLFRKTESK